MTRTKLLLTATLAIGLVLATSGVAGAQQEGGPPTQVRLAHFSPDTPPMDVWVTGLGGDETKVLGGLGYRDVSAYVDLSSGSYTFSMRPAGSGPDADPVVSEAAQLNDATAYTFAALGREDDLRTELITDDLTAPAAGEASVRLVHAADETGEVQVRAVDGPTISDGLGFGDVTGYTNIPATSWEVEIAPQGAAPKARSMVDLPPGSVVTLIVSDLDSGSLGLTRVIDARGIGLDRSAAPDRSSGLPAGGIETGAGGTAPDPGPVLPLGLIGGGVALMVVVGLAVVAIRLVPARR